MMHDIDPFAVGTAYATYMHGLDRQTEDLVAALGNQATMTMAPPAPSHVEVTVRLDTDEDDRNVPAVNALDFTSEDMPESWDDYIGQEPLKRQIRVAIAGAQSRREALQHILLASGVPGCGKTAMARLIAKTMDVGIFELVPPFNIYTLVKAAEELYDRDCLFIDEIHLLGNARAQMLLKIMAEKVAYMPDGEVIQLHDITIIGATTDKDLLPEPILQRFKLRPFFQPYTYRELSKIAIRFADKHDALDDIDGDVITDIAYACRGVPRITEEFILAARDMTAAFGRPPTGPELLDFLEVEPDGLTRTHIHYLTALRQYYQRSSKAFGVEYIAGEATMMSILRETKPGVQRLERYLTEIGLVNLTPRGRKLTTRGVDYAERMIREGKGSRDV